MVRITGPAEDRAAYEIKNQAGLEQKPKPEASDAPERPASYELSNSTAQAIASAENSPRTEGDSGAKQMAREARDKLREFLIQTFEDIGYTYDDAVVRADRFTGHMEIHLLDKSQAIIQANKESGYMQAEINYSLSIDTIDLAIVGNGANASVSNEHLALTFSGRHVSGGVASSEQMNVDIGPHDARTVVSFILESSPLKNKASHLLDEGIVRISFNQMIPLANPTTGTRGADTSIQGETTKSGYEKPGGPDPVDVIA